MKKETGIQKNIGNFRKLIARCKAYKEKYNPANEILTLDGLNIFLKEVRASVITEIRAKKALENQTEIRKEEFKGLGKFSTRIMNALISCGASQMKIDHANTHHRNLNGKRAVAAPETKEKDEDVKEEGKGRSVSQLGFDNMVGHFEKLVETISSESKYNPNEQELSMDGLHEKYARLDEFNETLKDIESAWMASLIARNSAFNDEERGLVAVAFLVKSYVKSVYTVNSPQFKRISGLAFTKIKER